jgi:branched-chain amino acid aminotransferase
MVCMQTTESLPGAAQSQRYDPRKLAFGTAFSETFFSAEYRDGAWREGRVEPLHPFSLHPATLVLHYAQTIFEGLKAFRQPDGSVRIFRADMNARRFDASARRMGMPPVGEQFFVDAVSAAVAAEKESVLEYPGSLYIRPVMFASEPHIGVRAANEYIFFIMTLPAGAYFPDVIGSAGAVTVYVAQSVLRACPGGTGNVKTAANYAVTLQITTEAKAAGCSQVLFLDSTPERRVEEMGGMNIMFVEGDTVVTPPLGGTILPGVTRDAILQIARDLGINVREYAYTLAEMAEGIRSGRIGEAYACGTAAVITGIRNFKLEDGSTLALQNAAPGPVTSRLFEELVGIQYGKRPDRHGWLRPVQ